MSENYAQWAAWDSAAVTGRLNPAVGDYVAPPAGDAAAAPVEATAGFAPGSWLPPRIARSIAVAEARERGEARAAEREAEARREGAHAEALELYRSQAESRGEVVSAMAIATGEGLGRSLEDVLADVIAAADHEDARQAAKAHREAGLEPEHVMVGRSDGWPESPYQLDRLLERASDLHRWGVVYQARLASRRGEDPVAAVRSAQDASRARSEAARRRAEADRLMSRGYSRDTAEYAAGGERWPARFDSYGREITR